MPYIRGMLFIHLIYENTTDEPVCRVGAETQTQGMDWGPSGEGRGGGGLTGHHWHMRTCSIAHSCPTPRHPVDCGPPRSSVRGISQARVREWVAMSSSRVYQTMCKIVGRRSVTQGAQPSALWWPRRLGCGGEAPEERDAWTHTADERCTAETTTAL